MFQVRQAARAYGQRHFVARRGWWPVFAIAAVFAVGAAQRANGGDSSSFFEYLYVESNSGDSSGGHAAICFANRCYHFQQDEEQTIRLHEDDAEAFEYRYRLLGNRTIHASRVAVLPDTYERLHAAFAARLHVQDRQYEVLESLVADRQLIESLLGGRGAAAVRVPGSGYFFADQQPDAPRVRSDTQRSATLDRLAAEMRARYGDDMLERRAAVLHTEIAQLIPAGAGTTLPLPEANRLPLVPAGFAARYRELVSGWLAMETLRAAPPLRAGSFHASHDRAFALTAPEIDMLRTYATQLTEALMRLPASSRPDWGYPLLVGMARLIAVQASIESGYLVLLDDFPEDAPAIPPVIVSRHAETFAQIRDERRADMLAARHRLLSTAPMSEANLSLLETAGNLFIDVEHALSDVAPMRVYAGHVLPVKAAVRHDWPVPELAGAVLSDALAVAYGRERTYRAALEELYPYDVIAHNCVTEIFRILDAVSASNGADAAPDGTVAWRHTLGFIPFLSTRSLGKTYHLAGNVERPSYRRLRLDWMYRHENSVRVDLRESNVFTAQSYERNPEDPIFLFFTDNVLLRRPLYGVANIAVGIGGMLAGLAWLPVDGGATLRAGLDGTLFSIPELAFVNIRKGSFAFAPRAWLREERATPPLT